MKKRQSILRLAAAMLALSLLLGCNPSSKTTLLNSVDKFFSNEAMLEATARELIIEGDEASVRIHLMNLDSEPLEAFSMHVSFLDSKGEVLYVDAQEVTLEIPLESYESTSITATCSGKKVKKITSVAVEGAQP